MNVYVIMVCAIPSSVEKAHTGRQETVNGGPTSTGISRRQPTGIPTGQKMPNYLQLTKAATSKRIGRYVIPGSIHVLSYHSKLLHRPAVSKENKGKVSESNGKPKTSKLLSHRYGVWVGMQ